jgi:hypothetical protein
VVLIVIWLVKQLLRIYKFFDFNFEEISKIWFNCKFYVNNVRAIDNQSALKKLFK